MHLPHCLSKTSHLEAGRTSPCDGTRTPQNVSCLQRTHPPSSGPHLLASLFPNFSPCPHLLQSLLHTDVGGGGTRCRVAGSVGAQGMCIRVRGPCFRNHRSSMCSLSRAEKGEAIIDTKDEVGKKHLERVPKKNVDAITHHGRGGTSALRPCTWSHPPALGSPSGR